MTENWRCSHGKAADDECRQCDERDYNALKAENGRLRATLGSAVLLIDKLKKFGSDNVQRYDVEPWRRKVLEEFPDLPNAWHPWERSQSSAGSA